MIKSNSVYLTYLSSEVNQSKPQNKMMDYNYWKQLTLFLSFDAGRKLGTWESRYSMVYLKHHCLKFPKNPHRSSAELQTRLRKHCSPSRKGVLSLVILIFSLK